MMTTGTAAPLDRLERWLAARRAFALTVLMALSVLVRVVYFLELNAGPCVWWHLRDQSDMNFFDQWARNIAEGDWLTDKSLHPDHVWYTWLAQEYFRLHPDRLARYGSDPSRGATPEACKALWDHWYRGKCFHQEPLYPYLIAITYRLFGADPRWVFAWQLLIGTANVALLYLIARRVFGDLVGVTAGALALLCGPLLFYELVLLRVTLLVFTQLLALLLADRALERPTALAWLLAGVAFGAALLLRTTNALFLACAGLLLIVRHRRELKAAALSAGALIAGVAIALSPLVARNLAVGVPPLATSSVGPIVFVFANESDFFSHNASFFSLKHAPRIMGETDGAALPTMIATLRTHRSLASYLVQLADKFGAACHWYEIPNNVNFYYYRLHAAILRLLPVTFRIVFPFGLAGMILALGLWRRAALLYALVLSTLAPLLVFYVLSRLRMQFFAALIPFAALGLVGIACLLLARKLAGVALLAGVVALMLLPAPPSRPLIDAKYFAIPYDFYYNRLAQGAIARGDWSGAAEIWEESLRIEPKAIRALGPARPARGQHEIELALLFAAAHQSYANALLKSGRAGEAASEAARAKELSAAARPVRSPDSNLSTSPPTSTQPKASGP